MVERGLAQNRKQAIFAGWMLLFVPLLLLGGCRQSQSGGTADLTIELISPLFPSLDGSREMSVRVIDVAGQPVNDAQVDIKGDMTHAGKTVSMASTPCLLPGPWLGTGLSPCAPPCLTAPGLSSSLT